MVTHSHGIVAMWRKYFSRLFNVDRVKDVFQAEINTVVPLLIEPSSSEFELAIGKLTTHKSPSIDQIPADLIETGCRKIHLQIHKLIIPIWKKEKLRVEWKESIKIPIHKKGDK